MGMTEDLALALFVTVVGGLVVALVGSLALDAIRGIPKRADARMKRLLRDLPEAERERWREELRGVLLESEGRPLKQMREGREAVRAAERLAAIYGPSTRLASNPAPDEAAGPGEDPAARDTTLWLPASLTTEMIAEVLSLLSYRERRVLEMRHGLAGSPVRSAESVGRVFAISPERVETIERQALMKLHNLGEAQKLREIP